jgi:hypothetical protein
LLSGHWRNAPLSGRYERYRYGVGLGSLGGGVSLGGVSAGGVSDGGGVADGSVGIVLGVVVVVSAGGGAASSGSFRAQPAIRNAAVNSANRARMKVSFFGLR